MLEGRRRDVESKSKPNHMDSFRLDFSDIDRMCEMSRDRQFQGMSVARMDSDAVRPPAVPTREQQSIIVVEETACAISEKPRPWWLPIARSIGTVLNVQPLRGARRVQTALISLCIRP